MQHARTHLDWQFAAALEEGGLLFQICDHENWPGRWFDDIDAAVAYAEKRAPGRNVYFGAGMLREQPEEGKRASASQVAAINSLWLDLDVAGPAHSKPGLMESMDEAIEFAQTCMHGLPPSYIVCSGHGVQAYWLFSEPWILETQEERRRAAILSERFSRTASAIARPKGRIFDSVFDLSRIMRLPGTMNNKLEPVAVEIIRPALDASPARYHADDFDGLLIAEEMLPAEKTGGRRVVRTVGYLTLAPGRKPDPTMLHELMDTEPKFKLSLENKRKELPDQSASSYDMSLATIAVKYGWDDQSIADLLIYHREQRGHDLKTTGRGAMRQDYYQRTIGKARAAMDQERAARELESEVGDTPVSRASLSDDERTRILARCSEAMQLPIARVVQYGAAEKAIYLLELTDGSVIKLGTSRDVLNQQRVRERIFPVVGQAFRELKTNAWITLINLLGVVMEYEENPESEPATEFQILLSDYIQGRRPQPPEKWHVAIQTGQSFVRDGKLHLRMADLEAWLSLEQRRYDAQQLVLSLREHGFRSQPVGCRISGKSNSRRYWVVELSRLGDVAELLEFAKPGAAGEPAPQEVPDDADACPI